MGFFVFSQVVRGWLDDSAEIVRPRQGLPLQPLELLARPQAGREQRPAIEAAQADGQWAPTLAQLLQQRLLASVGTPEGEPATHANRNREFTCR